MTSETVDRSDGMGILYVFIRLFALVPTQVLREILMIPPLRKVFFWFFKILMNKQLKTRKEFPDQVQKDKHALMMAIFNMTAKTVFNAKTAHIKRQRIQMFLNHFSCK